MQLKMTGEVVKIYELETSPTQDVEGDSFYFRLELVKEAAPSTHTKAVLWRKEFFRVQPTFPQQSGEPCDQLCDELHLVEETHLLDQSRFPASMDYTAMVNDVLTQLNARLYGKDGDQ